MTPPPSDRGSRTLAIAGLLVAGSLAAGCYQSIQAPECSTLADCPSGQGYTACEEGRCFKAGKCDGALPVAGDACCALTEGDRTADTDCLVADQDLECREPAGPVADGDGGLFVTCRTLDGTGAATVTLVRVDPGKRTWGPIHVGPAFAILPPMVSRGVEVYAAWSGGVGRYDAFTGEVVDAVESDPPIGGLASADGGTSYHSVVGWPTASGNVVLYDEDLKKPLTFTAGPVAPGVTGAFRPTISAKGRRMYVLWEDGTLWSLETVASPVGPVASVSLPKRPVAPPVEVDGRIFVALEGGTLVALAERAPTFETVWSTALGGEVAGGLLVDPSGAVVAVLASGAVVVVRDLVDRGSMVGRGDFAAAMGDVHPFLAATPRVVAVAADGRTVASLRRQDEGGAVTFLPGLSFGVPVAVVGTPLLLGRSLWMATESGRLVAWHFPDDPPAGRFVRGGADEGGTGRTTPATP